MSGGMSVADVLSRAADLIEPEGAWTQEVFSRNADGTSDAGDDQIAATNPVCWCVLGALAHVVSADPEASRTFAAATDEPQAHARIILLGLIGQQVEDWNDAPGRTQSEVVAKLREAATLAASVQS